LAEQSNGATRSRRALSRAAIIGAVEDSGPGISPNRLDSIFDPFNTTKANGMGLGLAICRMIVERHGGKLSAMSDGKSGARFQFVLPVELTDATGSK
jgi:signal transduction histidine kinase